MTVVLDASAVLAFIHGEAGAERVLNRARSGASLPADRYLGDRYGPETPYAAFGAQPKIRP
jgi:hypothetical protein